MGVLKIWQIFKSIKSCKSKRCINMKRNQHLDFCGPPRALPSPSLVHFWHHRTSVSTFDHLVNNHQALRMYAISATLTKWYFFKENKINNKVALVLVTFFSFYIAKMGIRGWIFFGWQRQAMVVRVVITDHAMSHFIPYFLWNYSVGKSYLRRQQNNWTNLNVFNKASVNLFWFVLACFSDYQNYKRRILITVLDFFDFLSTLSCTVSLRHCTCTLDWTLLPFSFITEKIKK